MDSKEEKVTEEIKTQHEAINEALGQIKELLSTQGELGEVPAAEVLSQVEGLRDLIIRHFDFEELQGRLEESTMSSPQVQRTLQVFNTEHGELIDDLAKICAMARALAELGKRDPVDLREAFGSFLKKLHEHETRELDAIKKSYLSDAGSES
jgi:hemerythrin-like domain-containing protein